MTGGLSAKQALILIVSHTKKNKKHMQHILSILCMDTGSFIPNQTLQKMHLSKNTVWIMYDYYYFVYMITYNYWDLIFYWYLQDLGMTKLRSLFLNFSV